MTPLNSPPEVGIRIVFLLDAAFPRTFDINQLVLADQLVLHSADSGGPPSLHPPVSIREGELGQKRALINEALQRMVHSGLVVVVTNEHGITFRAGEGSFGFVRLFQSPYAERLKSLVQWVVVELEGDTVHDSHDRMLNVMTSWSARANVENGDWEV